MNAITPSERVARSLPGAAGRDERPAETLPTPPPLVSVLVECTAGDGPALATTVESLLAQAHRNVEVTLCGRSVDGWPGNRPELLEQWVNRAWSIRGLAWEPGWSAALTLAAHERAVADRSMGIDAGPSRLRGDRALLVPAGVVLGTDEIAAPCRGPWAGGHGDGSGGDADRAGLDQGHESVPGKAPRTSPFRALTRRARLALSDAAAGVRRATRRPGDREVADELGIFDRQWYLEAYPDVAAAGTDPFRHYVRHGWREGRIPFGAFDEARYRRLVPGYRPGRASPVADLVGRFRRGALAAAEVERIRRSAVRLREGVTLSGYLCSEIGLGQAARMVAHAMDAARVPLCLRDLPLPDRANEPAFRPFLPGRADRRVSLLVAGMEDVGRRSWPHPAGARRLLYPFWELSGIPEAWRAGVRGHDAVWAPSTFVASALRAIGIDAPVMRQPLVVPAARELRPIRAGGIPLAVLTYLDFDSCPARKNVRASVAAFLEAFPAGREASLTVKVRGNRGQGEREWLEELAARDPRIRVIDATIPWSEVEAMVRDCDVFLSLHRSEGFGFGAAEALSHAKAVVATDHGGTTDFVRPDTGHPVRCTMVDVRPGEYPGGEGQRWAEPDVDDAARALRAIDSDRGAAAARGAAGRVWMQAHHSPPAAGRVMREWLQLHGWLGQAR